ncbi:MAG: glycosyltransferase [Deltaproteobacteria bacterium]|nr:glycosyltransferase [Deltaproteobacteria bacterium]
MRERGGFRHRLELWFGRLNLKRADLVLACSHRIACLEAGYYKVHPDRFSVLFHAFDREADPGFLIRAGDHHDGYFLVVGNVEYLKGFDLIAEAFYRYRKNGGTCKLFVAGTTGFDDPNPQVQKLLKSQGVQRVLDEFGMDTINFLGKISKLELAHVRAKATAVLIGSRFEAFTMVAGEAFLCGCPVLISDRTGWVDLVERYQAAKLFSPYDPEELANAMLEMEDSNIRRMYASRSLLLAEFLCSEELAQKTVKTYISLLEI